MNRKGPAIFLLIILISALVFSGCTRKLMWSSNSGRDHIQARYQRFTGTEKKGIRLEEGDTLVIDYQSEVSEGTLNLTITDPEGNKIVSLTADAEGSESLGAKESGKYTLNIRGDKTGGFFEINWNIE
jgi:hypothetical protein